MNRNLLLFKSTIFKRLLSTAMSSYKLVCLGNPLLDLQANVDQEYLKNMN